MKDTKEIVLFFKDNTSYTPLDVAKELLNRYPELGNPLILPESDRKKIPLILFNTNDALQLEANYERVTLLVKAHYFDHLATVVFDIIDTFADFKCDFYRMGYLNNIFLSPDYVQKAKERLLQEPAIAGDVQDYNLSFYRQLDVKGSKINVWERFATDQDNFADLLCRYDCNTPKDDSINLDMKYLKDFFKVCDEFIESRLNF